LLLFLFQDDPVPAHPYYQLPYPRLSLLTKLFSQTSSSFYPTYLYPTNSAEKVRQEKKNVKIAAEADYYNQWIMSNVG
jgi:hypothetical protein